MERPRWNDLYTVTEMSAALRLAAARIAKQAGAYALAEEITFAAECIEDLADKAEQVDELREKLARVGRHVDEGLAELERKLQ